MAIEASGTGFQVNILLAQSLQWFALTEPALSRQVRSQMCHQACCAAHCRGPKASHWHRCKEQPPLELESAVQGQGGGRGSDCNRVGWWCWGWDMGRSGLGEGRISSTGGCHVLSSFLDLFHPHRAKRSQASDTLEQAQVGPSCFCWGLSQDECPLTLQRPPAAEFPPRDAEEAAPALLHQFGGTGVGRGSVCV